MKNAVKFFSVSMLLTLAASLTAFAQRPRSVNDSTKPDQASRTTTTSDATTSTTATTSSPQTVRAKYEGGVFGNNKKMEGTLSFDDVNNRLVFRDKVQKEILSIPYTSIAGAYADNQSRRPAAATVLSNIPFYGLPAAFIRKKVRYLTLQFNDPDTKVKGVTSFRLDNKQILASTLNTLATKAGLTQRGEIYVRKEPVSTTTSQPTTPN
ncbi:MAG: hypothetical protein ABR577_16570 [Pyrinomonadaceae bacterium]